MTGPTSVLLPGHDVPLGRYTVVRRLLPQRPRRMVGAWCFVDHFGPDDVSAGPGMQVPPHPHTGLQTVSWLAEGEILHRDSVGSLQTITPGQLNVMTSGHGISHSEESPAPHPPVMHGLQLWVALPDDARHGPARFDHYPTMPVFTDGGATVTVVVGSLAGLDSPAVAFSPLLGAEIVLDPGASVRLPLDPAFEYGAVSMAGAADILGDDLKPGSLLYLDRGRSSLVVRSEGGARLFLLGGEPFDEPLVMWWNFVGRTHEEIAEARADWERSRREVGGRFGTVRGYAGDPLPAPELPTVRLKARDRFGTLL
ncbi:pirin family protein [Virgisporangium ochraceum]|uniref:pirin family protein n=1 Tax=Virgisporangium ochraceum TaxID=65505 RepID=UPI0019415D42|nr:pirin family protein [Virgisporangium ochraceum]